MGKKVTVRYNPATDIALLKEVLAINPFQKDLSQSDGWDKVASNFNFFLTSSRPDAMPVITRSVKERFDRLMKTFKTDQLDSLRK